MYTIILVVVAVAAAEKCKLPGPVTLSPSSEASLLQVRSNVQRSDLASIAQDQQNTSQDSRGFVTYDSVGVGECMTPNGGPRGNHCFDGPRFSPPWMTKAACQSKCEEIPKCSAYEWGREHYYNCALYIHTTLAHPASLGSGWTCNFWSAGQLGTQPVTRAHDSGHKGECFVRNT